jgi:hypothetical protein
MDPTRNRCLNCGEASYSVGSTGFCSEHCIQAYQVKRQESAKKSLPLELEAKIDLLVQKSTVHSECIELLSDSINKYCESNAEILKKLHTLLEWLDNQGEIDVTRVMEELARRVKAKQESKP